MSRKLRTTWDGDQPIYRYRFRDGETWRDFSTATAVFYIADADGNAIATRPGTPIGTKSNGYVDFIIRGQETDWDGLGKVLYVKPIIYCAQAADRTPAPNLLLNASFDTYTGGSGVADNWSQSGTLGPNVYEVRQDDPAPPVIFGKCQRSYCPTAGSTAYIYQIIAGAVNAGDYLAAAVWRRAKLDTGAALQNGGANYRLTVADSNGQSVQNNFAGGDSDWRFEIVEMRCNAAGTSLIITLFNSDALGYEVRYDEAFLFKGRWAQILADVKRLEVKPRSRPSKTNFVTENFIDGHGGFEQDSNGDGVADGWSKTGTLTYSIERDPDHVDIAFGGFAAQKVVLAGSTTDRLRLLYRAHFKAGERWRFQVHYKNSNALSGSPANGDFGLVLHTEEFDGPYEESSLTGANFLLTSQPAYLTRFRELTLANDHSVLVLDINLKTASGGTLWLDTAILWRNL